MKAKLNSFKIIFILFSLSLFLVSSLLAPHCFSLPVPEEIISGSAEFSYPDPSTLQINAQDKTIINYQSFDIGLNESVIINLPSVDSEVLNRVLGDKASEILGKLTCNGIFILVNKNGIYFGPQAQVDVASIIASTRDITDSDFLSSKYIFGKLSTEQLDILLRNQGTINIQKGGFGVLIAGAIENSGTIVASLGTIALAGADMVTLEIAGDGLISVAIDRPTAAKVYDLEGNPITDQLKNTGTLQADGGVVLLKAEALPGIFENAINLEGYVKAERLESKDGEVKLISSGNIVMNAQVNATKITIGKIDEAIPQSIQMQGGNLNAEVVSVVADRLSINSNALLTEVHKTGDINLTHSFIEDNLITLEGDDFKLTYLKTNNLTLQADNNINTTPGVIIQANQLKLIANRFGTTSVPLNLEANSTHIQRLSGEIAILESVGIGSTIMLRGPPEGFGAIIYPKDTCLILEASPVLLSGTNPIYFYGDITFYNFFCAVPDKEIYFEAGHTYTFKDSLSIQGSPDLGPEEYHIKLYSSQSGTPWYLDVQTQDYSINRVFVRDAHSLHYLFIPSGVNLGNNLNIEIDPTWDGGGTANNWGEPDNWDGNVVPQDTDAVTFDGTSSKDCTIDNVGSWSGGSLTITSAYTGTITQNVAITVTSFSQAGGTFTGGAVNMTTGTFTLSGGTFNAPVAPGSLIIGDTFTAGAYSQTSGTFIANASDIICYGNYSVTGGTYNANNSKLTLDATPANLTFTGGGYTFNQITFKNTSNTSARTITLGSGTFTFNSNFYLNADGAGNLTLDCATNNPNVTINGKLAFTGTGTGTESISMGSGTWTVAGNIDLTGGTITSGTSTLILNANTTGKTITSGGASFYNLTFNGVGGGWTLQDDLDVDNNLTITSGTLNLSSYTLTIGADFTVNATFTASTGKVVFDDASKITHIYGTTFYDFECTTPGKELQFEAGSTETINGSLTIIGANGNLIRLRSTISGTQWKINPQGTINIAYVDVKDSYNLNGVTINPPNSIDSGNNNFWFVTTNITQPEVEEATKEVDTSTPPIETTTAPESDLETSPSDYINLEGGEEETPPETEESASPQEETSEQTSLPQESTESSAQEETAETEQEEALSEAKKSGFDFSTLELEEEGEDKKYKRKYYLAGKYKTVVIVFEGRVVVAPYDERGIKQGQAKILASQQKIVHTSEIK
ncbi:MAG: filamentous hemagglutinin N-terminal domain-containing protein [Candidatus Omnitrophica bacterium]|nr:filamentous hemagglutinin N-terminal domain-containing protein [Candidatus Omnitrophota bacterium]